MNQPADDIPIEPDRQDMIVLMISYLDNQLDEASTARLDSALVNSTEMRELFVSICMHRRLMYGWMGLAMGEAQGSDPEEDAYHQTILGEIIEIEKLERLRGVAASNRANEQRSGSWLDRHADRTAPMHQVRQIVIPRTVFWGAIAALLLLSAILLAPLFQGTQTQTDVVVEDPSPRVLVARVIESNNADWASDALLAQPTPSGEVYNKPLRLTGGSVRLRFLSGAEVAIQAPAFIEPVAANRLKLSQGSVVGYCPTSQSRGFTVDTPSCRVVDVGTEFGVSVENLGYTECHVFTGRVEVAALQDGAVKDNMISVTEGYAVSVVEGEIRRDIALSMEKFGKPYEPLLAAVRSGSAFSQEVLPRGMKEGVLAFNDRDYTWLSIPQILKDADYVLTSNAYGTEESYTATLQIDRPAEVYVLWHPVTPTPQWLTSRFVKTQDTIRLGGTDKTDAAKEISSTPRDLQYQVWRYTMSEAGELELGKVASRRPSGGMYAIAVTPIGTAGPDALADEAVPGSDPQ